MCDQHTRTRTLTRTQNHSFCCYESHSVVLASVLTATNLRLPKKHMPMLFHSSADSGVSTGGTGKAQQAEEEQQEQQQEQEQEQQEQEQEQDPTPRRLKRCRHASAVAYNAAELPRHCMRF